jgi:Holliday junction resolvasome RuvABC endonuclease subunit
MAIKLSKIADIGHYNILFIDPSGSHLAYVYTMLDIDNKELLISKVGMVWTKGTYTRAERLRYMQSAINILIQECDIVFTETFFSNPGLLSSSTAIVPTVNCFIEMAASEHSKRFEELGASTWRSILGIKAIQNNGKRDYKVPTASKVAELLKKPLPSAILSNITLKERDVPNDVTDALAIALAISKYHEVTQIKLADIAFNDILLINKLNALMEDIK